MGVLKVLHHVLKFGVASLTLGCCPTPVYAYWHDFRRWGKKFRGRECMYTHSIYSLSFVTPPHTSHPTPLHTLHPLTPHTPHPPLTECIGGRHHHCHGPRTSPSWTSPRSQSRVGQHPKPRERHCRKLEESRIHPQGKLNHYNHLPTNH